MAYGLGRFLNHYGVGVFLLIYTFYNPSQAFSLANYVFHCKDKDKDKPWLIAQLNACSGPNTWM
jgi:hypothetical protein